MHALAFCTMLWFLAVPFMFAHAAVNAGVVNGVWFSNPNPQEGEVVRIFTAVQNQSDETISGTVTFLVNEAIVGSKTFSVASNDVIPVSINYTFSGGTFNVSAYISAVEEEQSVSYTFAPKTSVSVARKLQEEASPQSTATVHASSTVQAAADAVVAAGESVLATAKPVAEAAAGRVEQLRDTLLQGTSTKSQEHPTAQNAGVSAETKAAAQDFVATSKTIVRSTELPLWKKAAGVLLTFAAFLLRMWFVFVVLLVAFVAWRLLRGVRIR